jgi:cytochrome c-type biogenesis protein CcmH/NrfG
MYLSILLFVIIVTSLFLCYRYFILRIQKAHGQQKNLSSGKIIINKKNLSSFIGFIFVTVLLYFGLGRPDLLQPQLHQKKLELAYIKDDNNTTDTDENAELLLLYTKLQETLAKRPRDISGYSLLVKICLTLKKYPEARLAQEKVLFLKKSASNINDYVLLLDTYLIAAEGRFSIEASKILKKVKIKYPMNENTHFFLILEHLERKEYKAAIQVYKKLKRGNVLGTEKLILLENKFKKIGFSNNTVKFK